jgi:hypothetical protein
MKANSRLRDSFLFTLYIYQKNIIFRLRPKSSFSQEAEDLMMRNYLPEESGSYLDVGSGLPIWGSNTYLFYRFGWRGICIDALDRNIQLTKRFRPGDVVTHALVGSKFGKVNFWEFDSYEYSTANEAQANLVMESEDYISGKIRLVSIKEMDLIDINSFLVECKPADPYLLSVDIEGFDLSVLQIIDWSKFRPRVICVEDSARLFLGRTSEIDDLISGLNYLRVGITPLSSVYVARDYLNSIQA